jgi:SAM-dependent methyltransferase
MNMESKTSWLAYDALAWTESIISPPNDYTEETTLLVKALKENSTGEIKTILHLGCGAGGNDYTFKKYFKVTGVDISYGMLDIARKVNPEIIYHHGDMRNIELGEYFDAVVVPDSIDYIRTEEELSSVMMTANKHLKPGGMLLIVAHPAERFIQNNFVYTGSNQDVEITIFENNYIPSSPGTGYEATLVYLIRHYGKLEIYTDRHFLGLFKLQVWLDLFNKAGFDSLVQADMDHVYDRFIVNDGKYPQLIFTCTKPQQNTGSANP